jgi:hypothetical protein
VEIELFAGASLSDPGCGIRRSLMSAGCTGGEVQGAGDRALSRSALTRVASKVSVQPPAGICAAVGNGLRPSVRRCVSTACSEPGGSRTASGGPGTEAAGAQSAEAGGKGAGQPNAPTSRRDPRHVDHRPSVARCPAQMRGVAAHLLATHDVNAVSFSRRLLAGDLHSTSPAQIHPGTSCVWTNCHVAAGVRPAATSP